MNKYRQNSIEFLPPQIYEFSRLGNFRKLTNLMELIYKWKNNCEYHVERMLSICYEIPEAMILVMPGDAFYPLDASFTTPILSSNRTLKDFDSEIQNRLIMIRNQKNKKWQVHYKNKNENTTNRLCIRPLADGWDKL